MNELTKSVTALAMGETHVSALCANVMSTPIAKVRFWIISMMLVLFGLSTLKLR